MEDWSGVEFGFWIKKDAMLRLIKGLEWWSDGWRIGVMEWCNRNGVLV